MLPDRALDTLDARDDTAEPTEAAEEACGYTLCMGVRTGTVVMNEELGPDSLMDTVKLID